MGRKYRLIRIVLFALSILLLGKSSGFACSRYPEPKPEELFSEAASVVVAHVTKTEEASYKSEHDVGVIVADVRVIEVIKGQPPIGGKIKSEIFLPGNCTMPILAGMDYIFYIDDKENFVTWITGSVSLMNINAPDAQRLLERLRAFPK